MLINFKKLEQLGFELEKVEDGLLLQAAQANDELARRMHRTLMESTDLSPIEVEQVLDDTMTAVNRLIIARAITSER